MYAKLIVVSKTVDEMASEIECIVRSDYFTSIIFEKQIINDLSATVCANWFLQGNVYIIHYLLLSNCSILLVHDNHGARK